MTKYVGPALLALCGLFAAQGAVYAAGATVPEPFQDFDPDSTHTISYDDLSAVLKTVVVDVGRSNRRIADEAPDVTGTRMKSKISKTANEGNRFYFETFDDEEARQFLRGIQTSLEQLPGEVPLAYFSRDEQLAYWLNLYNVTVLNQIIEAYPKRNLKKLVAGRNSIFSEKLLNVAGIPLSLDDIQFTILKQNYDNNPLIMYGLYEGIVGGPNIRKSAYTGETVYRDLKSNALEFINSNRGTMSTSGSTFRVSSLYERNDAYFPEFDTDLTSHLLDYIEEPERTDLQAASKVKANIDDWNVTDLGGSQARVGGSFADSRAALMNSMQSNVVNTNEGAGGATLATSVGYGDSSMASKGRTLSRIDPGLLVLLHDIDDRRREENQRKSTVEIEELGDSDAPTGADGNQ